MSYETPYAGLKVVDLSQGVAGPYCAMLLAQYGANVIKVEPTENGDWSRGLGIRYGDNTAYSIPSNLGKRSIALDLKQDAGRAVLWRLIAGCRRVPARLPPRRDRAARLRLCRTFRNASRASCMFRSPDLARPGLWRNGRRWTRCCKPTPG